MILLERRKESKGLQADCVDSGCIVHARRTFVALHKLLCFPPFRISHSFLCCYSKYSSSFGLFRIVLFPYGYYKQATVGDVNIPKPGMTEIRAKAKFDAWSKHKGMSKDAAKAAYIATYQKYAPKYA